MLTNYGCVAQCCKGQAIPIVLYTLIPLRKSDYPAFPRPPHQFFGTNAAKHWICSCTVNAHQQYYFVTSQLGNCEAPNRLRMVFY